MHMKTSLEIVEARSFPQRVRLEPTHSVLTAYELRKIWKNVSKYIRLYVVQLYSSTFHNGSFFEVFFRHPLRTEPDKHPNFFELTFLGTLHVTPGSTSRRAARHAGQHVTPGSTSR